VENPLLMIFVIGVIADMPMKGDEMEGTCSCAEKELSAYKIAVGKC